MNTHITIKEDTVVLPAEEQRRRAGEVEEAQGEEVGEELVKTCLPLRYLKNTHFNCKVTHM